MTLKVSYTTKTRIHSQMSAIISTIFYLSSTYTAIEIAHLIAIIITLFKIYKHVN